jgi:hypothetical protein
MKGITPNPMSHLVPLLEFNPVAKLDAYVRELAEAIGQDVESLDIRLNVFAWDPSLTEEVGLAARKMAPPKSSQLRLMVPLGSAVARSISRLNPSTKLTLTEAEDSTAGS